MSRGAEKKILICRKLVRLCELLSVDISFRSTPIVTLLGELLSYGELGALSFIDENSVKEKTIIKSLLSSEENAELSSFLFSLGKSDKQSQLKVIEGFKQYIKNSEKEYSEQLKKNERLYLAFGFFSGALLVLTIV